MQALEKFIQDSMAFWQVPGCAIAIVKGNKVLLNKGFGKKRLIDDSSTNQVNEKTLFPIASLTKPFTAIAMGLLFDKQLLNWDDPLIQHYDNFNLTDVYAKNHLTIRDCLSMCSGLPGPSTYSLPWFNSETSQNLLIEKLAELPLTQGFRGGFAYQNLLYLLVAKVIEKHTGLTWEHFIEKHVLDVLNMHETQTNFASLNASSNKAFPHRWNNDQIIEVPYENLDNLAPAAGLSSCAADMANWLLMLINDGKFNQFSFIQPATLATTLSPQTIATPEGFFGEEGKNFHHLFFPNSPFLAYSYGWFIHDYQGLKICQTPGLADGMNALMVYVPVLDLGLVILNNLESSFFSHALLFHVIDTYLGLDIDWNSRFKQLIESGCLFIPY